MRLGEVLLARANESHDVEMYARAEAAAREALNRDPKHFGAMVLLGSCHLARHQFREAIDAAGQALAVNPEATDALGLRADALMQTGELIRAREDCERVLAAKPDLFAHARMARLQLAEGDTQAALTSLQDSVAAGERDGAQDAARAWALVRLGELRFRTGDWDDAGRCYDAAMKLREDDADVHDHLAELCAARGEFDQAVAHSDRAIALSPRPAYLHARGDIHAAMKDAEAGHAWHERALAAYLAATEAGHLNYHVPIATLYCESPTLHDPEAAVRWARRATQARRSVDAFAALAWSLYQAGQYDAAADAMDRGLRQRTADAIVLYHAGLIYSRAGDTKKGATYLRRAATANAKFNEFHSRR